MPPITRDMAFVATSTPLQSAPLALYAITNPQWDGDLDNDGNPDTGPTAPPFGAAPLPLVFNATNSIDWDGGTVSCHWDFGDGSSASGAVVNHTFARGNHHVVLTVVDDEGQTAHQRFIVRAMTDTSPGVNGAPVFGRIPNVTIHEGQPLHLMPVASDPERNATTYSCSSLTYTATGLPAGATYRINPASYGDFLWTPAFDQASLRVRLSTFAVIEPLPLSCLYAKRNWSVLFQISVPLLLTV